MAPRHSLSSMAIAIVHKLELADPAITKSQVARTPALPQTQFRWMPSLSSAGVPSFGRGACSRTATSDAAGPPGPATSWGPQICVDGPIPLHDSGDHLHTDPAGGTLPSPKPLALGGRVLVLGQPAAVNGGRL